ncbi:MAG: glycosyl transferase [Fimbriimonadales bacterium]|nr:MAG: glycosyl transferase [Fimbriimonadales bacterium]
MIVTTYNQPRFLALVLSALARQTFQGFDVIVADDGSHPPAEAALAELVGTLPFRVRHVWHPDQGFRKCSILNKALRLGVGEYVVFLDGDCITPCWFLEAHVRAAQRGRYVTGGKVSLARRLSEVVTLSHVQSGFFDRISWALLANVDKPRRVLAARIPLVRTLLNRNVPRPPVWRGENSSTFAEHLFAVGGFDERFTYGCEDADLGYRLQAAGVRPVSIRYSAPVFHLYHERPYANAWEFERNRQLLLENRARGVAFTPYGLPSQRSHSEQQ